ELDQAWTDLASEPVKAYRGIWTLTAASERSVKLLGAKLSPVKVDQPRIRKLVADLDARRFPVRETALKELRQMGHDAEQALSRALKGAAMPERSAIPGRDEMKKARATHKAARASQGERTT